MRKHCMRTCNFCNGKSLFNSKLWNSKISELLGKTSRLLAGAKTNHFTCTDAKPDCKENAFLCNKTGVCLFEYWIGLVFWGGKIGVKFGYFHWLFYDILKFKWKIKKIGICCKIYKRTFLVWNLNNRLIFCCNILLKHELFDAKFEK
jgi:hypothetical protein